MSDVDPLYLAEGAKTMNMKRMRNKPLSTHLGISLNEVDGSPNDGASRANMSSSPYMHRQQMGMPMSMPDLQMPSMPSMPSKHDLQNQFIPHSEQDQMHQKPQHPRHRQRQLQHTMEFPDSGLSSDFGSIKHNPSDVETLSISQGPSSDIYSQAPVPDFYYSGPQFGNSEYSYPTGVSQRMSEKDYYESPAFDDIPSSPPSSPARQPPMPHRQRQRQAQRYGHEEDANAYTLHCGYNGMPSECSSNPLGITPAFNPNVMRVCTAMLSNVNEKPRKEDVPSIQIDQNYDASPYDLSSQIHESNFYNEPNPLAPSLGTSIPELSPVLSDVHSPSSPFLHEGFTWQPIMTVPRSEHSEAIIEQQRKPKQKRKSCLPEGVVDEYVGYTETEGTYVCLYPNCLRIFKRTYNLRSHIQTHLCDRPYVCPICESTFVRPHDLRRHERCHTNDRPFVCPCGKRFNRQDAMQRHRMRDICEGSLSRSPHALKSPKLGRGRNTKSRQQQHLQQQQQQQHQPPHISPQQLQLQQQQQQPTNQSYSSLEPSQHQSPAIPQEPMPELDSF